MPIYSFIIAGLASWFIPSDFSPAIRTSSPYVCAMNVVAPGTSVEVVNAENGRSSHCIVTGSGPGYDRVFDASPKVRDELGFTGLAYVRVYRITGYLPRCHYVSPSETCKTPPQYCVLDLPKVSVLKCK